MPRLEAEIGPLDVMEIIMFGFGMRCRVCGCTDKQACCVPDESQPEHFRGCYWAEPGLCSVCAGLEATCAPRQKTAAPK